MKKQVGAFNIILVCLAFCLAGCEANQTRKKAKDEGSFLRIHLETNPDGTKHVMQVPILRASPTFVSVASTAALDEGFLKKAELVEVDEHGGFGIKLVFDPDGTSRFDYLTTANKGLRLAIMARWTEDRWLAAPRITKRISDGVFVFTPDASRAEAERIVSGLNNVIKELDKPYTFFKE